MSEISAFYNAETDKIRIGAPLLDRENDEGAKLVFVMDLPKSILTDPTPFHATVSGELKVS